MAIEGFGNVGRPAAAFLEKLGVRLIAASDSRGAIYNPEGIAVADLAEVKRQAGTVTAYRSGKKLPAADLLDSCPVTSLCQRPGRTAFTKAMPPRSRLS